jgi:diacylglycerol kinase (ATP)
MEDVLFIVNPKAASGRAARVWSSLCARVPSLRMATVVHCGDAAPTGQAIRAALAPEIRRIVIVGGDGTLHHALNLLMTDAPDQDRCVGLIPAGTGSDLARGLGLETRPEHALAQALEAKPSRLDLLRLQAGQQTRYFINEASLGITALVAARVNALARRNTAAFLTAALRELVSYQPQRARIHLDGKLWRETLFYMVVVANGSHFAKGMRIAPIADPGDGQADVVVVEAAPKAQLLAWLPSIYLGKHIAAPFVHCARARSIDIETGSGNGPMTFEGDGEVTLPAPGNITLMPGAVLFSGAAR